MSRLYNRPMATKEPNKSGAAIRKAERMLMDNKKVQDDRKKTAENRKSQATKGRKKPPKDDAKGRISKLKAHLKKIIPSKMQGRK